MYMYTYMIAYKYILFLNKLKDIDRTAQSSKEAKDRSPKTSMSAKP